MALPLEPSRPEGGVLDAKFGEYSSAFATYQNDVLEKVRGYVTSGQAWYRKEAAFLDLPRTISHINGDYSAAKPKALSSISDNRTQKIAFDIASALTDVRPIWSYTSYRDQYKRQADVFSKCARYWWRHTLADRALLSAILNAEAGGSGFLLQQWNPDLPGGGDIELLPLGVQDVLPIGPTYSESIQDWQGVVIRQCVSVEALCDEYPAKASQIRASRGSWFGSPATPKGKGLSGLFTTAYARLFASGGDSSPTTTPEGTVDLLWVYIKDYSIHTGLEPRVMGDPRKAWSYAVQPGERLYPRGRLIKCVEQGVLKDGPNEYWHGQFPLTRVTLLPLPWSLLGASLLADLAPLQVSLNDVLRGIEDNINQKLRPAVVTNSSMAQSKLNALDMRQPGQKVRMNIAAGEAFELKEMPDLPAYVVDYIKFLRDELDENSGTQTLKMLAQMKQLPSADSMDKILDAMSPKLQLMASCIEVSLSEIATMFLTNVMQFYTTPRRYQMLGRDGVTMEDFDFDPGTLVPAAPEGLKDTLAERAKRAIEHKKNFIFSVERNTFLSISQVTRQLQILQLFRSNAIDLWSLHDAFDLPGTGPEPAPTIVERMDWAKQKGLQPGLDSEVAAAQRSLVLVQAQMAIAQAGLMGGGPTMGGSGGVPSGGGPPKMQGAPSTSGVGSQGGRPPSGQRPPQMESRQGPTGPRQVISESP